jgi:hypothetical protein
MRSAPSRKWAWTGIAFFVLMAVSVFLLNTDNPGEKSTAQQVMDHYNSHNGRAMADIFLTPLGAALVVIYFSYLRTRARYAGVRSDVGPTTMLSGAVIWAGGVLLGSVTELLVVDASYHHQAQVAQTANVFNNVTWIPFIAGIAVTLIGAGVTVLQSSLLPKWIGWVALVGGILSLAGPGGFVGFIVAPLFVLVSAVMQLTSPREIDLQTGAAVPAQAQAQAGAPAAKV